MDYIYSGLSVDDIVKKITEGIQADKRIEKRIKKELMNMDKCIELSDSIIKDLDTLNP